MQLEFRNSQGKFLFTLHEEAAERAFAHLSRLPEFDYTNFFISGKEWKCFICKKLCGYKLFGHLEFVMNKEDYIKVIP